MDDILIEIHHAKIIINRLQELEGIIKILAIGDILKNNMIERIAEIKELFKNAKLKEEVKNG